jgi:hypothetical protein
MKAGAHRAASVTRLGSARSLWPGLTRTVRGCLGTHRSRSGGTKRREEGRSDVRVAAVQMKVGGARATGVARALASSGGGSGSTVSCSPSDSTARRHYPVAGPSPADDGLPPGRRSGCCHGGLVEQVRDLCTTRATSSIPRGSVRGITASAPVRLACRVSSHGSASVRWRRPRGRDCPEFVSACRLLRPSLTLSCLAAGADAGVPALRRSGRAHWYARVCAGDRTAYVIAAARGHRRRERRDAGSMIVDPWGPC